MKHPAPPPTERKVKPLPFNVTLSRVLDQVTVDAESDDAVRREHGQRVKREIERSIWGEHA